MDCLFATQQTSLPDLIRTASVTAAVIVTIIALAIRFCPVHLTLIAGAVRFGPVHLREKLTFFAPYVALCAAIWITIPGMAHRLHRNVAMIIYLSAAFGFSTHNFQFPRRAHFFNGMIWGFLSGLLITTLASQWAFRLGDPVIHNNFAFWATHIIFVLCWVLICLVVYLRQRRSRSVNKDTPGPS